jgi:hypothetical protein
MHRYASVSVGGRLLSVGKQAMERSQAEASLTGNKKAAGCCLFVNW